MRGKASLTAEQKEWALREIAVTEGYQREDYADATDAELANGVLGSWVDYCRDKGLI